MQKYSIVFSLLQRGIKRQETELLPTEHRDRDARGSSNYLE